MAEIESILKRISKICSEISLDYVIVGGFAAIIMGKPRTTMDIDLIIEDAPEKMKKFLEKLKENDFDVLEDQVKWAFESGDNASVFDKHSAMRLDIKLALKPIDRRALASSIPKNYFDITLKIASVNYILLGKIWFLGDISDILQDELLEYNDIKDFINVYIENKLDIDLKWLKKQANELGLDKTLSRLLNYIKEEYFID
jgi:hypothetical protein